MIKDSILIDFILDNHTPIRAKLIIEALEGILAYNMVEIVPRLEELITDDSIDNMQRIEFFKMELVNVIKEIMRHQGIIPYREVNDFIKLSKVINGIDKAVTEYFPDYILDNSRIEVEGETDLDKLFSVINLVEGMSELDFYDVIHSVNDTPVAEILSTINSKVVPELESDDPVILERYKKFIKGRMDGVVVEFISNGGQIGVLSHDALLATFTDAILQLPVTSRSYAIVASVLISTVDDLGVRGTCLAWASYFANGDIEHSLLEREIKAFLD